MRKLFVCLTIAVGAFIFAPFAQAQVGPGPSTPVTCTAATCTITDGTLTPQVLMTPNALATSSVTLSAVAVPRLTGIFASWNVPTTIAGCWLTAYNSAAPTIGTSIVLGPFFLATASAGNFALPLSPTIGTSQFSTALTVAVTTTPTGTAGCNALANQLFISGAK